MQTKESSLEQGGDVPWKGTAVNAELLLGKFPRMAIRARTLLAEVLRQ